MVSQSETEPSTNLIQVTSDIVAYAASTLRRYSDVRLAIAQADASPAMAEASDRTPPDGTMKPVDARHGPAPRILGPAPATRKNSIEVVKM